METKYMAFVLLPLILQIIGLTFAVVIDPYIGRKHRRIMLTIIALDFSLIVIDYLALWLKTGRSLPVARTIVDIYGYSVRPLILLLFARIVSPKLKHWQGWLLVGLNFAVHLTALVSPVCFTITADNQYVRGPLGYSCHVVSGILLLALVCLTLRELRTKKAETWIPVFNALLIVASVGMDSLGSFDSFPVTFLTIAIVSSNLFYYTWLHLQFARAHERALMAEQRIQIMMTQIQPHFLFNTIATFKVLARRDPAKAEEVADRFGLYLRQNLDSLSVNGCIPFEKELEHTKTYADIEMVRFENVQVEYDVQDRDFSVPPLSLQPLVENAIRHGVRVREKGVVRVSTRRRENGHEITVADNGKGFDVTAIEKADGKHIGVRNVRERIEKMCGGALTIESRPDRGTTVTIRLPLTAPEGREDGGI